MTYDGIAALRQAIHEQQPEMISSPAAAAARSDDRGAWIMMLGAPIPRETDARDSRTAQFSPD
jgi:hypothetical protein